MELSHQKLLVAEFLRKLFFLPLLKNGIAFFEKYVSCIGIACQIITHFCFAFDVFVQNIAPFVLPYALFTLPLQGIYNS